MIIDDKQNRSVTIGGCLGELESCNTWEAGVNCSRRIVRAVDTDAGVIIGAISGGAVGGVDEEGLEASCRTTRFSSQSPHRQLGEWEYGEG